MKPVRTIKNQYLGINAHLQSYWQARGGWNGFHTRHIGDLSGLLRQQLLPMGYTADIASSLQIRYLDEPISEPESEVAIYDLDSTRSPRSFERQQPGGSSELVLPIPEIIVPLKKSEKKHDAIAVYELIPDRRGRGKPVAWIELLSPSNKVYKQDAAKYSAKRETLLAHGIVFVEMDYLHESSPTIRGVVDYRTRKGQPGQPGSHPYRILAADPRPTLYKGLGHIYEFDVDQPIPTVTIPLSGTDKLEFDFGNPYRKTFEEMLYGLEFVDYADLPLNFDRYSPDDQARIVARMLAVLQAAHEGIDLEREPSPAKTLSLERALEQLEHFGSD